MQAFVSHSFPVYVQSRQKVLGIKPGILVSPSRAENGSSQRSTFWGQEVRPTALFVLPGHHLSAPALRVRGDAYLCAKIPGDDDSTNGNEQSKNSRKRWWGFGGPVKEEEDSIDSANGEDKALHVEVPTPGTRNQDRVDGSNGIGTQPNSTKETSKGDEGEHGLVGIMAKLMESKRSDEAKESAESKGDKSEDVWTQFLNVIVPNRKRNEKTSGIVTDQLNTPEVEQDAALKSAHPLEKLRGIHELYEPPDKAESKKEAKGSREERKGNLITKILPWFAKRSKNDATEESESEHIIEKRSPPKLVENSVDGEAQEVSAKIAVLEKPSQVSEEHGSHGKMTEDHNGSTKESSAKNGAASSNRGGSKNSGNRQDAKQPAGAGTVWATSVEVSTVPQKDVAAIRLIFGSETFFATETVSHPGGLIFRGNLRGEPKVTLAKLEQRLASRLGDKYTLCLAEGDEDLRPVVVVVPTARDRRPASSRQKLMAIALMSLTSLTCLLRSGYANLNSEIIRSGYGLPLNPSVIDRLFITAPISSMGASIAIIVLFSQLVQRIMAARRKTRVALPYLIPSYQLGCFGGLFQIASPPPTRAALFDIAFSGALALVVVSLMVLIVGLQMSTSFASVIPVPISMVSSSVLIGSLTMFVPQGQILVDYSKSLIGLHPLAVIGANCLNIAALNLLPIRQLDGGRIVSAIYGRKTASIASRITIFFLLLASAKAPYYFVFLAAVTFGPWSLDRPAKNELTEPNGVRAVLGYILLLVMVSILLPHPVTKFFGTS